MDSVTETTIYIILDVILAFTVIIGNLLVCCVILYSRALRRKAMYMFVTSLALADIFVGLTAIPFGVLTKLGLPYNNSTLCIIMLSFIIISTQISIFNMTAISIERYIAIRHPRFHFTKLTPTTSFRVIVVTWLLSVLVGLLPVLGWNNLHPQNSSNIAISSNQTVNISSTTMPTDVFTIKSTTSASSYSHIQNKFMSLGETNYDLCIFSEIMDNNYMFFNFTTCVLPPLLICAALYFFIFLSLTRLKNPTRNSSKSNLNPIRSEIMSSRSSFDCQYEKPSISSTKNQEDTNPNASDSIGLEMCLLNDSSIQNENGVNVGVTNDDTVVKTERSPIYRTNSDIVNGKVQKKSSIREENTRKKLLSSNYLRSLGDDSAKQLEPSSNVSRTISESTITFEPPQRHHCRQNKTRKEVHAAGVLGMIVLAFVVCWLPIHIINTIKRFDEEKFQTFDDWIIDVAILLSHANSAVNFFLYSWRLKAFRKQLRRMLARRTPCIRWYKHR